MYKVAVKPSSYKSQRVHLQSGIPAPAPQGCASRLCFPLLAAWGPPGRKGRCLAVWLRAPNILPAGLHLAHAALSGLSGAREAGALISRMPFLFPELTWKLSDGFFVVIVLFVPAFGFYQIVHVQCDNKPTK